MASILGITDRGVRKRATIEGWTTDEGKGVKGAPTTYPLSGLPPEVARLVMVYRGVIPEDLAACAPVGLPKERVVACVKSWDEARPWQRELAEARVEVLAASDRFRAEWKGGKHSAVKRFAELYRMGEAPGVSGDTYRLIPKIGRTQVYEWGQRYREGGIAGLLSRHGHSRGKTALPEEQRLFIKGLVTAKPHVRPTAIATGLKAKFGRSAGDAKAVRRFIMQWRANDPSLWALMEDPDGFRSRYLASLGDHGEKADRFLSHVEVDSTIADVTCADGKRWAIIGGIDVFSRKTKFVASRSSTAWGIAGLVRAICLDWGIPGTIVRDNGQDYASKAVNSSLAALGVEVVAVPPFTPEAKPHIERVFGTMTRELLETLPGYCGHNVEGQRKLRAVKSFAERMGDNSPHGKALTAAELQDALDVWADNVYAMRPHSSLFGLTPNEKASQTAVHPLRLEARALDILLSPEGERTIGKEGLRYENGRYWHNDLIPYIGRKVIIRADIRDAGRVWAFDPETRQFIAECVDVQLAGITRGEYIAARKSHLKRTRARLRAEQTLAEPDHDYLADMLAVARQEARGAVEMLPTGPRPDVEVNPFVAAAIQASEAMDAPAQEAEPRPTWEQLAAKMDPEAFSLYGPDTPQFRVDDTHDDEPRTVIPMRTRAQEEVDRQYFNTPREKFEYLRLAQRGGNLAGEDEKWLLTYINDWFDHADMFADQWPERDRLWLGRLAPDWFPQYVIRDGLTQGENI